MSGNVMQVRGYQWPKSDTKLLQVFDQVNDIGRIIKQVRDFNVCVQAGGACGVWPDRFAEHFDLVFTFEPVLENYECLVQNVPPNVIHQRAALGSERGSVKMERDEFEEGNSGAWYATDGGDTPVLAIDDLALSSCGLIQLDVEGYELEALKGAEITIKKFKPVIVLEEKRLPHMHVKHTAPREWLLERGYRAVDTFHRDVLFIC